MKYLLFITLFVLTSCFSELDDVNYPKFDESSILTGKTPLENIDSDKIEGIYDVIEGQNQIGEKIILKWVNNKLTILTNKNTKFLILNSAYNDSAVFFEGYWRNIENSDVGKIILTVTKNEGYKTLIFSGDDTIIFNGYFTNIDNSSNKLKFKLIKKLKENNDFYVIGHRGGGRNSDRLGASENTIGMIKLSESLGCNSIEIDVKITKDNQLILYHDNDLNPRLIQETYMIGDISNYTYPILKSFVNLKNGGKIPLLKEALDVVIMETNLKLVWLDIKANGILKEVIKIQEEYENKAKNLNRDLEIYIGIPDEEVFNELKTIENYKDIKTICELSESKVIEISADIYAPRWSLGLQSDKILSLKYQNIKSFTWTLDDRIFIKKYLYESYFDGILTNYPTILAYEYYIK